ncbi:MAG: hypothetical protein CVU06_10660 [Bacteroidetes bacterium HGW-Bacteroidetes-22]|nr:MAG: hypothetical protein CVU06_10660 [Bacteroidetes bacterium HGW-Bacteroidetes-22]
MDYNFTICHVSTKENWRGGEQQLLYLFEQLAAGDVRQLVITPVDSALSGKTILDGSPYLRTVSGSRFKPLLIWRIACKLKSLAKEYPTLIVHVHDSDAHTAAIISSAFMGAQFPVVVSRRVDFPVGRGLLSSFKYNHRSVKRIICVSEEVRRITGMSIRRKEVMCVIYDGIDTCRFENVASGFFTRQYMLPEDTPVVGNVAAIAPHKDYYTFVDTAGIIHRQNPAVRFFIIGNGPLEQQIIEYIESKSLSSVITLCGFLDPVEPALKSLQVLLYTSKTEGLGSTIIDAYSAGVPVVCTTAGGIAEIAHHGENALTAPPGDAKQLATHVMTLLESRELRGGLIQRARKYAQGFSKEIMAQQTLSCYTELCRSTGNER